MNRAELFEMFCPDATTAEIAAMDYETVRKHICEIRERELDAIFYMRSNEIAEAIVEYAIEDCKSQNES